MGRDCPPHDGSERDVDVAGLLLLSIPAMVNEATRPLVAVMATAMLGHIGGADVVSQFIAVSSVLTFSGSIFSFIMVVTMSNVSRSLGARAWTLLGEQIRVALAMAATVGVVVGFAVYMYGEEALVLALGLTSTTAARARPYLHWRAAALPFQLVGNACTGVLNGFRRVRLLCILNLTALALEAGLTAAFLFRLNRGLPGVGEATFVAAVCFAAAALSCVVQCVPPDAKGAIDMCSVDCSSATTEANGDQDPPLHSAPELASVCGFFRDSGWMFCRSLSLQMAMFALCAACGRLGTDALAAHAVMVQLWMLTSYIVDGFADVGTMVVGSLLGNMRAEGKLYTPEQRGAASMRVAIRRLFVMAMVTGGTCGGVIFGLRDDVIALFTNELAVRTLLIECWPLLCLMQLPNAAVFFLDGILAAQRAFRFSACLLMLVGAGVYVPALWWGCYVQRSLLGVWLAKAALNSARCLGAVIYTGKLWI